MTDLLAKATDISPISSIISSLEKNPRQLIILAIAHPDLTARLLLQAGITVTEAFDTPLPYLHNLSTESQLYIIFVEGDMEDIEEVINRNRSLLHGVISADYAVERLRRHYV